MEWSNPVRMGTDGRWTQCCHQAAMTTRKAGARLMVNRNGDPRQSPSLWRKLSRITHTEAAAKAAYCAVLVLGASSSRSISRNFQTRPLKRKRANAFVIDRENARAGEEGGGFDKSIGLRSARRGERGKRTAVLSARDGDDRRESIGVNTHR